MTNLRNSTLKVLSYHVLIFNINLLFVDKFILIIECFNAIISVKRLLGGFLNGK